MTYLSGRELSAAFYTELVRPLLDQAAAEPAASAFGHAELGHADAELENRTLKHSAALLGTGSEVVGYDTERSVDHDWGPRLEVFLRPEDQHLAGQLTRLLDDRLPETFRGYPVRYSRRNAPAQHHVTVGDLGAFLTGILGFDPRAGVTVADWLRTPTQSLLEITGGAVFHDGLGELGPVIDALAWYPDDLWRYVLACRWTRIGQEEHFVGRCGEVGDELGSAVLAARLCRDLIRLCLLMERRYPPYAKWLGTAFSQLPAADQLGPELRATLAATSWQDREKHLCAAYEIVAALHNDSGMTEWVDPTVRHFHDRPYRIIGGYRFATALQETIRDPQVAALPPIGAVDQFADNTNLLGDAGARLRHLNGLGQP